MQRVFTVQNRLQGNKGVRWQIMRCVDIGASNVPDIALSIVILDLEVLDLQESEVIASRNRIKKESGTKKPAFS
jgi:hypothetical protein